MTFLSDSIHATEKLGRALGATAFPGAIVALWGDLGAGKTAITRGAGLGLHIRGRVTSPTFTLVHQIPGILTLYHMDLYRLSSPDEAVEAGITEMWFQDGVTFVEWPEKAGDLLPNARLDVIITILDDDNRKMLLVPQNKRYEQWVMEAMHAYSCY